jgi:hypothetical protein
MTITLPPELESRLRDEARRRGMDAGEYARRLIEQLLGGRAPVPAGGATIDLIEQWEADNATDDPAELARRQQEGEEFMRSLGRSREDMEGPGARKIWP